MPRDALSSVSCFFCGLCVAKTRKKNADGDTTSTARACDRYLNVNRGVNLDHCKIDSKDNMG